MVDYTKRRLFLAASVVAMAAIVSGCYEDEEAERKRKKLAQDSPGNCAPDANDPNRYCPPAGSKSGGAGGTGGGSYFYHNGGGS